MGVDGEDPDSCLEKCHVKPALTPLTPLTREINMSVNLVTILSEEGVLVLDRTQTPSVFRNCFSVLSSSWLDS